MTLIKILVLSLFVFIQAKADTIYNLIKIPNLEIYEINTSNKLRYLYAKQPFTIGIDNNIECYNSCLLYTSPSPRDGLLSRMPSSA